MSKILEVRNVTKIYPGVVALDNVSFDVEKGEILRVHCDLSEDQYGRTLILATGTTHRTLGLDKEDSLVGKSIHFCAVCDGDFYTGKEVIMVGGGNSALQEALLLADKCSKVTVVQDLPYLTGEQRLQDVLARRDNVGIITGQKVAEILTSEDGSFKGIRILDQQLEIINVGHIPEEITEHVFEPFVSSNSKKKGHGLGLYIASYYAKLLDLSVAVKNMDERDKLFTGICLSRNRGHQNALLAGLMTAKEYADIIISMDADLQDDINAIDEMIAKYYDGNEIVYGVRSARKTDTYFKKTTAEGFYKFMELLGVDIVYNHADYRLTSKRVLNELEKFDEVNLFLRGMFPLIGFKSDIVYYERNERFAGESKYPLKKMLNFAWEGITSFSVKPITIIKNIGIITLLLSLLLLIVFFIINIIRGTLGEWNMLGYSIWIATGINLIALGIVGEYVGKIYSEVKKRPKYIISDNLNNK